MISSLRSQPQVSLIELGEWYYFPGGPRDIALWETPVQMTKGDILVAIIKRLSIWTQLFTNRVLHFFSFFFFFPGTIPELEKFLQLTAKSLHAVIFLWPSSSPLAPSSLSALKTLGPLMTPADKVPTRLRRSSTLLLYAFCLSIPQHSSELNSSLFPLGTSFFHCSG